MTPLVSIIIPVYKVEEYIEKCMQSLLDQSYENFEALVVDDGSPDNSITLAKELVGDDPRFIFLEKENGGQGSARNLGLDHARGDYIAFLDSDDYYEPDYLDAMIKQILKDKADICLCDIFSVSIDGHRLNLDKNDVKGFIENKDYLISRGYISNFMWDKLFDAKCFDGIRFDSSIRSFEDVHLLFKILFKRTLTHVNKPLYNYVQRPGSTMHSIPETYIQD
ncbi:glycosyltransferase family 2 protein, partial [Psychrobacter piechaudii]|uniref:glycosyltransferase family 2 protein n=1 Tax=Psychrobacter piechaudii TaxID=1945521 RepID=UPI00244857EC